VALPGIFFWELTLGTYLIVKGFKPSLANPDEDGRPQSSCTNDADVACRPGTLR